MFQLQNGRNRNNITVIKQFPYGVLGHGTKWTDFSIRFYLARSVGLALSAAGQFLYRNKQPLNYYTAVSYLCLSYVLFYFWCVISGRISSLPLLAYSDISATYIVAPAIYLMFVSRMNKRRSIRRPLFHFIIPALVTFGFLLHNFFIDSFPAGFVSAIEDLNYFQPTWLATMSLLSDLWLFSYILAAFVQGILWQKAEQRGKRTESKFIVTVLAVLLAIAVAMLLGDALHSVAIFMVVSFIYGIIAIGYSLSWIRLPPWSGWVKYRDGERTALALLEGKDRDALIARLFNLMEREMLYKDPQVNLASVAKALSLTSRQTSALINARMGMNFRTFLNYRRLQEVERELIEQPKKSVLEIAFENGFNSKTSFNSLFIRKIGESPREYRKGHARYRTAAGG